ncbi:MAG: hypothetical protein RJQ04_14660 [Longimicrobiales bacterium]
MAYDILGDQVYQLSGDNQVRPVGRSGQGPGEYWGVNGIAVSGESDVAIRSMDGRMIVLSSDGRLKSEWRFSTSLMHDRKLVFNADGTLSVLVELAPQPAPFRSGTLGVVRLDQRGTVLDTLGPFETPWDGEEAATLPNQPRKHVEWSPAGVAVAAVSSRGQLVLSPALGRGDTVAFDVEEVGYSPEEMRAWSAHAEWLRGRVGASASIPVPPPTKPAFLRIIPSRTGEFWVQLPTASGDVAPHWSPTRGGAPAVPEFLAPLRFLVLDSQGRWVADLVGPAGYEPVGASGDTLWAYRRGALGVFSVVRLVAEGG